MFGASVEEDGQWWSHVESIIGDRRHGDMWQPGALRKHWVGLVWAEHSCGWIINDSSWFQNTWVGAPCSGLLNSVPGPRLPTVNQSIFPGSAHLILTTTS